MGEKFQANQLKNNTTAECSCGPAPDVKPSHNPTQKLLRLLIFLNSQVISLQISLKLVIYIDLSCFMHN